MGYIGNQQTEGYSQVPPKQDLTGATGTSLTLTHAVASAEGIDLFINNVRQEPTTAYSVGADGVTVTLTGSVVATDDIYVVYNSLARQTSTHPSNQALQATSGTFSGTVTANAFAGDGSSLTGVGVAGIASSSTSGTAINIDANNIVTMPTTPRFKAMVTSNTAINATTTLMPIRDDYAAATTAYASASGTNVGGGFDNANNKYVVQVTGLYQLHAQLSIFNNNTSARFVNITISIDGVNQSDLTTIGSFNDGNSYPDYDGVTGSYIAYLTAGQELKLYAYATQNVTATVDTSLSGYLIG